jgi:signal transduction histidine kinase
MINKQRDLFFKISLFLTCVIVLISTFTDLVAFKYEILPWGIQIVPGVWFHILHGFTVGFLPLYAITNIIIYRMKTKNVTIKQHLNAFLVGAIFTFTIVLITNIILQFIIPSNMIPPIGTHSLVILVITILYSMIKHQFLHQNIEVFTKELLHDSHDGIIILNSELKITYINEICARYFDKYKTPLNMHITNLIPSYKVDLENDIDVVNNNNKSELTISINTIKVLSKLSAPTYILFARDTTYKKKILQLEIDKKKAEEMGVERSRFMGNIQHEFMTPMHSILTFSKFGIDKISDEKSKKYFHTIKKAADQLYKLLSDLIEIAKIESGGSDCNFKEYSIIDSINQAIESSNESLKAKSLTLKLDITCQNTNVIYDYNMIVKAFDKIISNAIKYSTQETEILIKLEDSELQIDGPQESITISITDKGAIIPTGERESIFTSFYESTKTRSEAGGIGIGLALCKKLVIGHNGTIRAFSDLDKSTTTVEIILPKTYNLCS